MPLAEARWTVLMQNWLSLAFLWVHHAWAAARLLAYPASTVARAKAATFARVLGYATAEAAAQGSLPPPMSQSPSYHAKDLARSRCDHKRANDSFATKQYNRAGHNWMLCQLCERRWKLVAEQWQISDKDAPKTSLAKPKVSQPSSSRSAASPRREVHELPQRGPRRMSVGV